MKTMMAVAVAVVVIGCGMAAYDLWFKAEPEPVAVYEHHGTSVEMDVSCTKIASCVYLARQLWETDLREPFLAEVERICASPEREFPCHLPPEFDEVPLMTGQFDTSTTFEEYQAKVTPIEPVPMAAMVPLSPSFPPSCETEHVAAFMEKHEFVCENQPNGFVFYTATSGDPRGEHIWAL